MIVAAYRHYFCLACVHDLLPLMGGSRNYSVRVGLLFYSIPMENALNMNCNDGVKLGMGSIHWDSVSTWMLKTGYWLDMECTDVVQTGQ